MASRIGRTFARRFSSAAKIPGFHHPNAEAGEKLWERLSLFVAIPACILTGVKVLMFSEEHERPEFIPYEHLRIHNKPFPWGDGNHTLFHNPKVNALPTGYEE